MKFRVWSEKQQCWKNNCWIRSDGKLYAWSYNDRNLVEAPIDFIVTRFTDVLDQNGKEIYEGDIVQFDEDWFYRFTHYGTINWMSDGVAVGFMYLNVSHPSAKIKCYLYHGTRCKIIGNIYENPELLDNSRKLL